MIIANDTKHPLPIEGSSTDHAESHISRQNRVEDDARSIGGDTLPPDYDAVIAGNVEGQEEDNPNLTSCVHELDFVGEVWYGGTYRGRWTGTGKASQVISVRSVQLAQHAASEIKTDEWRRIKKNLEAQVDIWKALKHPNVLRVYGYVEAEHPPDLLSLVSPVIAYDSAMEYISANSTANKDLLTCGIARGLTYLHAQNPPIIHGSLSAETVQVTRDGIPLIFDMGIREVMDISPHRKHNMRWLAPEIMMSETPIATTEGDVYAYALTSYEIMTELLPFGEYHSDLAVKRAVVQQNQRPHLSSQYLHPKLCSLWKNCWEMLPNDRPTMTQVLKVMESIRVQVPKRDADHVTEQQRRTVLSKLEALLRSDLRKDGNSAMLVIDSSDGTQLSMLDVTTGLALFQFSGHRSPIRCLTVSSNHRFAASVSVDGMLCIWDMLDGSLMISISATRESPITSICLSPIASIIAAAHGTTISAYDIASSQVLYTLGTQSEKINDISISPDGLFLAGALHNCLVKLWDMRTKNLVRILYGHNNAVRSVCFTPDSSKLASCSDDFTVRLWDRQSGTIIYTFDRQASEVRCLAFSPDGSAIVSATAKVPTYTLATRKVRLDIMDINSMSRVRQLTHNEHHEGRFQPPCTVGYSLDGTLVAVSFCNGKILVWDTVSGEPRRSLEGQITTYRNFAFTTSDRGIPQVGKLPLIS